MKLTTTFWSEEIHSFDNLLYINGKTQDIVFQTNLNDSIKTSMFFKSLAKFVKTPEVRRKFYSDEFYQFAVMVDKKVTPIIWFGLVVNDKLTLSHDLAFRTTLIKRNGITMPFGNFPMYYDSRNIYLPKYWQLNVKARAYKFIANQING